MKLQTAPLRVLRTTQELMTKELISKEPKWLKVVAAHFPADPPVSNIYSRPVCLSNNDKEKKGAFAGLKGPAFKSKKPSHKQRPKLFRPPRIAYQPEDKLRKQFYEQHPWELARPRVVVETDGRDYTRKERSEGIRRKDAPLDGESVVQRTIWLVKNRPNLINGSQRTAYEIACNEFYKARMSDEVQRKVALEEASMFGAIFDKTPLEIGLDQENKVHAKWLSEGIAATKLLGVNTVNPSLLNPEEEIRAAPSGDAQ